MTDVNWEMIIFIIIAGLIIFAGMGIFIGTRISSDKRRIRELEDELAEARKDLEAYRSKVNTHFKRTSELFNEMTNSYKAVYMHLAQGSQELCTTNAALLKPANAEFLKVTHQGIKPAVDTAPEEKIVDTSESPAAQKPEEAAAETMNVPPDIPPDEKTASTENRQDKDRVEQENQQEAAAGKPEGEPKTAAEDQTEQQAKPPEPDRSG